MRGERGGPARSHVPSFRSAVRAARRTLPSLWHPFGHSSAFCLNRLGQGAMAVRRCRARPTRPSSASLPYRLDSLPRRMALGICAVAVSIPRHLDVHRGAGQVFADRSAGLTPGAQLCSISTEENASKTVGDGSSIPPRERSSSIRGRRRTLPRGTLRLRCTASGCCPRSRRASVRVGPGHPFKPRPPHWPPTPHPTRAIPIPLYI